jgi:hypothetical protein
MLPRRTATPLSSSSFSSIDELNVSGISDVDDNTPFAQPPSVQPNSTMTAPPLSFTIAATSSSSIDPLAQWKQNRTAAREAAAARKRSAPSPPTVPSMPSSTIINQNQKRSKIAPTNENDKAEERFVMASPPQLPSRRGVSNANEAHSLSSFDMNHDEFIAPPSSTPTILPPPPLPSLSFATGSAAIRNAGPSGDNDDDGTTGSSMPSFSVRGGALGRGRGRLLGRGGFKTPGLSSGSSTSLPSSPSSSLLSRRVPTSSSSMINNRYGTEIVLKFLPPSYFTKATAMNNNAAGNGNGSIRIPLSYTPIVIGNEFPTLVQYRNVFRTSVCELMMVRLHYPTWFCYSHPRQFDI